MPVNIKGNQYVTVNERVQDFHKLYPNGRIESELIEFSDRYIMKTIAIPDVKKPERFFTGYAYEMVGSSQINKTSALENCETSSVGRALGFLNIGIDGSMATAEEIANAIHQQEIKYITQEQIAEFDRLVHHECFKGKVNDTKQWWSKLFDGSDPYGQAQGGLIQMQNKINEFNTDKKEEK